MKILLFTGYSGCAYTADMLKIMKKYNGIRGRIGEIVEYVENNCVEYYAADYVKASDAMKNNKDLIVKYKMPLEDQYAVWDANMHHPAFFSIVDVDTSRPWTIEEYDGAESVRYLDERKCIDEELNYWSEK